MSQPKNCKNDVNSDCAETFGRISERLKAGDKKMDYLAEKIDEIHHLLVGNGKPGLCGRIDRLEQARAGLWRRIERILIPLLCAIVAAWAALSK